MEKKTGATLPDLIRERVTKEVTEQVTLRLSREDLRATLEECFGSLPEEWLQRIEACKDAVQLRAALRQAWRVKRLEDLQLNLGLDQSGFSRSSGGLASQAKHRSAAPFQETNCLGGDTWRRNEEIVEMEKKANPMLADLVRLEKEVTREITEIVTKDTNARVTEQVTLRVARENLQALLEERFGPLPEELLHRIECCEDAGRLRSAFRQGLRLKRLDDLQL